MDYLIVYLAFNWICCITTFVLLAMSLWQDRSVVIKPSIVVIGFYNLTIQWAGTFDAIRIYHFLPKPWMFALLTQVFPLIGLCVSLFIFRKNARLAWGRIISPSPVHPRQSNLAIRILALYFLLFIPYYLSVIPLQTTGLYAIFTNPSASDVARENSLKLVSNPIVSYGYAFMLSVFGPLLAVLLTNNIISNFRWRKFLKNIPSVIGILLIILAVSLSGARSPTAIIILTIFLAIWLRYGSPINIAYIFGGVLLILAPPTILTILREGRVFAWSDFWIYLGGGTLWRVFYLPMETGLWHVQYAQLHGFFGIQAIPRVAGMLGIRAVNVSNIIALAYTETTLQSTIANTAYPYAYYSYFGPVSFLFSLIGLWLLDLVVLVYKQVSSRMLLPFVSSIMIASVMFDSTEYTIALITNGFVLIVIVSLIIDKLSKYNYRLGYKQSNHKTLAA